MTPPSASFTSVPAPSTLDRPVPTKSLNGNGATPATANHATEALASYKPYLPIQAGKEPIEDYNGNYRFAEIHESYVSRAMTARYFNDMMRTATSDVIVVGAGSAGLTCAYRLAKSRPDLFVTVVEAGVAPGGGAWLGGQLFSAMVVRKPAHRFLDEIGVAYDDEGTYVVIKHAALFTSTLLSKLLALPNVKLYNATAAEDLIVKKDPNGVSRVCGIVSNWTQVTLAHGLQSCMDPQTISAPVVVSATGHDGPFGASSVKRLANAGLIQMGEMAPLDQGRSEDLIVNGTDQIFPGIICCGMEISEAKSVPRMGPTFGGMFASGLRAAKLAEELHDRLEIRDNVVVGERVAI